MVDLPNQINVISKKIHCDTKDAHIVYPKVEIWNS